MKSKRTNLINSVFHLTPSSQVMVPDQSAPFNIDLYGAERADQKPMTLSYMYGIMSGIYSNLIEDIQCFDVEFALNHVSLVKSVPNFLFITFSMVCVRVSTLRAIHDADVTAACYFQCENHSLCRYHFYSKDKTRYFTAEKIIIGTTYVDNIFDGFHLQLRPIQGIERFPIYLHVGVFLGSHDDVRFEPKHAVIFPRHFEPQVNAPTNVIRFIVKTETSYLSVI